MNPLFLNCYQTFVARTVNSLTSDTQLSLNLSRSTSATTAEFGAGSPHSCDESTLSPDSNDVGNKIITTIIKVRKINAADLMDVVIN